jgi:hypothetical protein
MLTLEDPRWTGLRGGYRVPYDPRPALAALEASNPPAAAWKELWNELHHQGDVDEASYAAVPHLVQIHTRRGVADWNTYALVATIDDARRLTQRANPSLPPWLAESYAAALRELAAIGLWDFRYATDATLVSSILSILAIEKGQPFLGRIAIDFSDEERCGLLKAAGFA